MLMYMSKDSVDIMAAGKPIIAISALLFLFFC
jgi:hypothetical protein